MTMEQNLKHRDQTLRDVITILQQYLDEAGPCDHSVNICVCGIRSTLDDFGRDCYHRTGGAVGWKYLRFDVDLDDPKQCADHEASSAAEAMNNIGDIAIAMMKDMQAFRLRQLAIESAALNPQQDTDA